MQNLVKTWEMELSHKIKVSDFKTIDQEKFRISVNGELLKSPRRITQRRLKLFVT